MIKKIEHIGIAVKDLKKSEELFEKILGEKVYAKVSEITGQVDILMFLGHQMKLLKLLTKQSK